jgi:hypothetical protein
MAGEVSRKVVLVRKKTEEPNGKRKFPLTAGIRGDTQKAAGGKVLP